MDELPDIFARGFRLQPQGKSAPMAASRASASASTTGGFGGDPDLWPAPDGSSAATSSWNKSTFGWNPTSTSDPFLGDRGAAISDDYVFVGAPGRSNSSSHGQSASSSSPAAFDSVFDVFADSGTKPSSSLPVYDKPVYDDDVLDGIPGAKGSSSVKYDDVFASVSSGPSHVSTPPYEDLLENLGKQMPDSKGVNDKRSGEQEEQEVSEYDELIPGFGGSSLPKNREDQEASQWKPDASSAKPTTNEAEDPFVVLESVPTSTYSSSGLFSDPSENINRHINSGSMRVDTSVSARIFDDGNAYDGISKSVPWSTTEMDERQKDKSLLDDIHNIFPRHHDSEMVPPQQSSTDAFENIMPQVQPTKSSDLQNPFGRSDLHSTDMYGRNAMRDQSPKSYEHIENRDDVWLTVSEILLHTQPTSAPPPSRSPPPLVIKQAPFGADAKRKENESSRQSAQSHPYNENLMNRSPIDQLEDFAMGKPQTYARHHEDFFTSEEKLEKKLAAEAAMKEAMDRAEAKFEHAKEVREGESDGKDLEDIERQERLDQERVKKEREEKEEKRLEKEREQEVEREREKARQAAERAIREARERAAAEARLKAERAAAEARQRVERAAVQRAAAEARERAAAVARERAEKAALEVREKAAAEAREKAAAEARERAAASMERAAAEVREKAAAEARERVAVERAAAEARLRAQRAAVERAAAEARERLAAAARERAAAAAAAREEQQKPENDLESFFGMGARANSAPKQRSTSSETMFDVKAQTKGSTDGTWSTSSVSSSTIRKVSSTTNIVDDLTSIFGEIEGESEERRRARIERHQRTQQRAAKALAEKNERDMQIQREQAERHRIAETLDIEIKRWAAGKEGNLRALLSTLQYVLWPECGWQPVSLTDLIIAAAVKKVYRKATLCIHPDKVQQKGATLQQKYIAEKVFDLLKEAWNKFNSEELF